MSAQMAPATVSDRVAQDETEQTGEKRASG